MRSVLLLSAVQNMHQLQQLCSLLQASHLSFLHWTLFWYIFNNVHFRTKKGFFNTKVQIASPYMYMYVCMYTNPTNLCQHYNNDTKIYNFE